MRTNNEEGVMERKCTILDKSKPLTLLMFWIAWQALTNFYAVSQPMIQPGFILFLIVNIMILTSHQVNSSKYSDLFDSTNKMKQTS